MDMDYAALFAATPSPYLVLGPDLVIVEVNQAYLEASGRTREDLLGRHIFDAFPGQPGRSGGRRRAQSAARRCTVCWPRGNRTRWRCRSTTSP